MLKLLRELECFDNRHLIATGIKKLESDWVDLQFFPMWNYSHQNMKISDADAAHCATYALGGTFDHEHVGECERCTRLTTFFGMSFASFLNEFALKQLNNDQIQPEINTMINAV